MPGVVRPTPLAKFLAARTRARGPLTFSEYMQTCLYHPEFGYYMRSGRRPRQDYFTNVDAGRIYGSLIARQLREMWETLGRPQLFLLVELGAGTGELARHVLDFAAESFAEFYSALQYLAVERSPSRRAAQKKNLESHLASGRTLSLIELPETVPCGCILSNEFFDALPVHRVLCEKGELREIYVDFCEEGFFERIGPLSDPAIGRYFEEQRISLADGQQAEAGLTAVQWMEHAGRRLGRGFVLTVDYGHEARELYDERHMKGTLLAYERHRASEDFYRAPGEQDMTAHVNFTALDLAGQRAGLVRTGLASQSNFLLPLARASDFAELKPPGASEREQLHLRLLFKTLIHPEGMGETFQVFIQHKGIDGPRLTGLGPL